LARAAKSAQKPAPKTASRAALRAAEPDVDCPLCPRLVAFRAQARAQEPGWRNAPVPAFGPPDARLIIVGLAPGLRGANRTGRPFTGDFAGDLLFETLRKTGFARGVYEARPDDGLTLIDCRIVNAVRCVPPQNKPTPQEIANCRRFLAPHFPLEQAAGAPPPRAAVALGRIAHESLLRTLGARLAAFPFAHGAEHEPAEGLRVFDSYHCSRYNTNTGVLTAPMFESVFARVRDYLTSLNRR
jgi:uracil-DNA glycosylase family 4